MDKNTKVLVGVVIVLVAVLGLAGGFILKNLLTVAPVVNNSTQNNSTTSNSAQSSTSPAQSNNKDNNYISADQAIKIAIASGDPGPDVRYAAVFVDGSRPYWRVTVYDNRPSSPRYGEDVGSVRVDAKTGQVM